MIGAGYYIGYVYSSVSPEDRAKCEAGFRQQLANQPEALDSFLEQCARPSTLIAMKANSGEIGAEAAAQQISSANWGAIFNKALAFCLIGGGIGAIGAAFARKKKPVG